MGVLARNVDFVHFIAIGFYSQASITRNINKWDSERNSNSCNIDSSRIIRDGGLGKECTLSPFY